MKNMLRNEKVETWVKEQADIWEEQQRKQWMESAEDEWQKWIDEERERLKDEGLSAEEEEMLQSQLDEAREDWDEEEDGDFDECAAEERARWEEWTDRREDMFLQPVQANVSIRHKRDDVFEVCTGWPLRSLRQGTGVCNAQFWRGGLRWCP